ncbi:MULTISPECIES: hypothetical protein [unclassified Streptomyces]|uniref:hypothetical protein n=1 Tax=unclassified Streptomyces TaxID=2593676 RepID=UPI002E2B4CA7|nr:hypothetical protein [Streptomyces sp. NBC_01429]
MTLFYYFKGTAMHLIALGSHASAVTYTIDRDLGQEPGDGTKTVRAFQKKKTVSTGGIWWGK